MILGVGIDLLPNRRVEQELARGEWSLDDGIFTPDEIAYCSAGKQPALRYAACFAVKEAALKALGLGVSDLGMFREAEVQPGAEGEYMLVLHGRLRAQSEQMGVRQIRVATARNADQTGAMVILEA